MTSASASTHGVSTDKAQPESTQVVVWEPPVPLAFTGDAAQRDIQQALETKAKIIVDPDYETLIGFDNLHKRAWEQEPDARTVQGLTFDDAWRFANNAAYGFMGTVQQNCESKDSPSLSHKDVIERWRQRQRAMSWFHEHHPDVEASFPQGQHPTDLLLRKILDEAEAAKAAETTRSRHELAKAMFGAAQAQERKKS